MLICLVGFVFGEAVLTYPCQTHPILDTYLEHRSYNQYTCYQIVANDRLRLGILHVA
jgi:hypothetical protein